MRGNEKAAPREDRDGREENTKEAGPHGRGVKLPVVAR